MLPIRDPLVGRFPIIGETGIRTRDKGLSQRPSLAQRRARDRSRGGYSEMDQGQLPGWDPLTGEVQQTLEKQLAARVWAVEGRRPRWVTWSLPWLWMNVGRRGLGVLLGA